MFLASAEEYARTGDPWEAACRLVDAAACHLRLGQWIEGLGLLDRAWATTVDTDRVRQWIQHVVSRRDWGQNDSNIDELRWRVHAEEWLSAQGAF